MGDDARGEWQEVKKDPSFRPPKPAKKTRLFADANFPEDLVAGLRSRRLSILHVNETGDQNQSDERLYQIAKKRRLVILTSDKDFWDDRQHPLQGCPGVILIDAQGDQALDALVLCLRESERWFGRQLKELLSEAVVLWHAYHRGERTDFERQRDALKAAIPQHLEDRTLADAWNQRLLNELGRHHDRGNLLRFLDDPTIEPTNNAAERALRPAVIARKVSHCSKNEQGARADAAFVSVLRTLAKSGSDRMIEGVSHLFQRARSPAHC